MTKIEKELWDKWTDQAQLFIIHNEDLEQDTKAETNIIEYNEAA